MKRIAILLLATLLILSAVPVVSIATSAAEAAQAGDTLLSIYTPGELLQLWYQIGAMLRINGYYPFAELEKGATGYEVTALQTQLAALGYYRKEIVANYGNGTYDAMRTFEKANSLKADGKASTADQQVLYSGAAAAAEAASAADTTQTDDALLSIYTPEELSQMWYQIGALMRANGTYPFEELQNGNVGYEVTALQTRLKELNYYQKEIVNTFGNGTYNAVRDFEKANGLKTDGMASAADQRLLFSSASAAYVQPITTNSNSNNDATSGATP